MGSLRNRGTRKDPEWYCRFRDADGKWKERHSKQPSKDAARDFLSAVEGRVKAGLVGIAEPTREELARKSITVRELADRFLGDVKGVAGYTNPKIKDLSIYRNQGRCTFRVRIWPTLGDRPAASVTLADVRQLRDAQLAAGLRPGSVGQTLAALSKLYTW